MKVIRPDREDIVKVTCSCGCDDYIQFSRYLESFRKSIVSKDADEELYLLEIQHDSENWPLSVKLRELLLSIKDPSSFRVSGKNEYHHSMMISKEQANRLYLTLKEDIENFDEETADFILEKIENFSPVNKQVNEYTLLIGNFNSNLMWIGADGADLESPPNLESGFYPYDIVIGWRFNENITRRDILLGWKYFIKKGVKYYISTFDAILGKEDIATIMGSIKYMVENTFKI